MNSRDPPSRILLLIITQLPPTFPLNNDLLFEVFKGYGDIKKILIFERGKSNKAFVEYLRKEDATSARKEMQGKLLSPPNIGKLLIHFSRLKSLDLQVVDNSRGTDYTRTNSDAIDELQYSKSDDVNLLKEMREQQQQTQSIRNSEIDNLLSDDEPVQVQDNWIVNPEVRSILNQSQSRTLQVSQIDERATGKMLHNVFSRFGGVEIILYEKNQKICHVQYQKNEHAIIAKEYLNNIQFFDSQLRIMFQPTQSLIPSSMKDEYLIFHDIQPKSILPPSQNLSITGVQDIQETSEMISMIGKVSEIKVPYPTTLHITMLNVFEALKIVAILSDYEIKGLKLNIQFK
ncbi:hypothetical protein pb186bvf_018133 [Paramecium bursaria]